MLESLSILDRKAHKVNMVRDMTFSSFFEYLCWIWETITCRLVWTAGAESFWDVSHFRSQGHLHEMMVTVEESVDSRLGH